MPRMRPIPVPVTQAKRDSRKGARPRSDRQQRAWHDRAGQLRAREAARLLLLLAPVAIAAMLLGVALAP